MCGIAGFVDFKSNLTAEHLCLMRDKIESRGPDASGEFFDSLGDYNIGLGHRRLSIIDISQNADQPMFFKDLAIVFNGEIYNYQLIRKELENLGYQFKTNSDTEVLLISFHAWKENCLDKLVGMFAFCIYNKADQTIFLARDRFGVKPLYFSFQNQEIIFASEIKSFLQKGELSKDSISHYFAYGYTDTTESIYKGIEKISPGTFIEINLKSQAVTRKIYWSAQAHFEKVPTKDSEEAIIEKVERLITESCRNRLVADVPVGIFLSGGYDSSLVTAICKKLKPDISTFTISFDEKKFDEGGYAKDISDYLGTNHHNFLCSEEEALQMNKILPSVYGEPFGDSSAIPTLLLSQKTSKHVKVALSADGGDEFFAGYSRYARLNKIIQNKAILRPLIASLPKKLISQLLSGKVYNLEQRLLKIQEIVRSSTAYEATASIERYFSAQENRRLLSHDVSTQDTSLALDSINQMLLFDTTKYLTNDILVKVDRASMNFGLEAREPLLDHSLFEYISSVPGAMKLKESQLKYILKAVAHKHIPKSLLDRPKKGFSVPIEKWMTTIYKEEFLDITTPQNLNKNNILNTEEVEKFRHALIRNEKINYQKAWLIFQFQRWLEAKDLV